MNVVILLTKIIYKFHVPNYKLITFTLPTFIAFWRCEELRITLRNLFFIMCFPVELYENTFFLKK